MARDYKKEYREYHSKPKQKKGKDFCGACGCAIRWKAWIPNETLNKAEVEKPDYHETCWRRDES